MQSLEFVREQGILIFMVNFLTKGFLLPIATTLRTMKKHVVKRICPAISYVKSITTLNASITHDPQDLLLTITKHTVQKQFHSNNFTQTLPSSFSGPSN